MENIDRLVRELIMLPKETPWLEFKHNNCDPYMIGKDISALANAAAYHERSKAYIIWGVDDVTHELVGTSFVFAAATKGKEELENWLRYSLSDNVDFVSGSIFMDGKRIEVLVINRAIDRTVMFEKIDYIRVGSYTKKLNAYTEMKVQLWNRLRNAKFEEQPAIQNLSLPAALQMLDYSSYYDLLEKTIPSSNDGVVHDFLEESMICKQDNGLYTITNLGAVLFSKKISQFPTISRKATRVVQYQGVNRMQMLKETTGVKGYAAGFEGLIQFIEALLPSKEIIAGALRRTDFVFPPIAIREAVANALIHQDFSLTGTGPLIELFIDRIEITNPGLPLVDINRIIDNPPRSRNEKLAAMMRRLHICEESGTGWDKIVISCEFAQLPAPKIDIYDNSMKVTLYAQKPYADISIEDKVWACYLHACIKHVEGSQISNSTLRERFGVGENHTANISRLIKETVRRNLVKAFDPATAPRYMKYIPFWA